ncbi:hypothetical protein [Nocardioides sp.]|uniref:hypothetical protein n=1 Tax=Nocardioides sp. TaxID=35761 RepID=UPI00351207B5
MSDHGFVLGTSTRTAPDLADLADEVATTALERRLEAVADLTEQVQERHADDPQQPPVEALEAICRAPDASLVLRSLGRRVEEHRVTWEQVWREPLRHDGGMEVLVAYVLQINRAPLPD